MTEGEDVVISGIGGKFPESNTVLELQQKLFAKEDFVTNEMRWTTDTIGVGKIRDIDTFDAYPFKMHSKLIRSCDPTTTQTLERAFEALIDAGMNPFSMGGRNIGVISASMLSDSENTRAGTSYEASGLTIMGHNRSMVANRISFTFNFTGPSFSIHTSWCGGMTALEQGAHLIQQGFCEAVIVTTASLIFYNAGNVEYEDLNLSTPGTRCKSFDANANGSCRSEGVVSFFLQKAKDAKRNYATVVKVTSDCLGLRACSLITFDNLLTESLLHFYKNNNIDPEQIAYLEADGSGIKKYDSLELNALAAVFAGRTAPLAIGSVKSNVGNTDASSSFLGITKSIIAMETGLIPPNIHYSKPNPDVPALLNGNFQPVTEAVALSGDLVAVNSLSISGYYGHAVLKRNTKEKHKLAPGQLPPDGLPRIIMLSARHESGAKAISEQVQSMPVDPEFTSLVNDVFQDSLPGYLWKSFAIVPSAEIKYNIKNSDNEKQPIWFVFSGMGSQFPKMGKDLLQIPVFAAAVAKCDAVLQPRGIDIYHIITADEPKLFENILNCFVGIATVQIGLVDILKTIGLEPDGMVGHSVGELGCSYADGCFTAEEMVLAAYARGKASLDSVVIEGMMAATGLGYQEMKGKVPASIDVACHNASDSSTLSGPTEDVLEYVKLLKAEGVFAKAVSAGNIAYHSRYIQPIAPKLLQYLQELIKDPKPRSPKWVSSSVPESDWSSPAAKLSSAEYHTNNLLNPVLFEEASQHIPKNAVVIEIAPHGLLQAILRRSLSGCVNVPLTNRNAKNAVEHLLEALGTLYLNNVSFDVNKLYPAVEYPVSRGTPYLAPLITYDHHETWFSEFESILQLMSQKSNDVEVVLDESNSEYNLWMEHKIENQAVLPSTQPFVYVWKLFFESLGMEYEKEPVLVQDVIISKQLVLQPCDQKLVMTVRKGTSTFGIMLQEKENFDTYITGRINHISAPEIDVPLSEEGEEEKKEEVEISQEEMLSVLSQFGYHLGTQFLAFKSITVRDKGFKGKVEWTGNMVTFLDAIFKLVLFQRLNAEQRFLYPSAFKTFTLDTPKFFSLEIGTELEVYYDNRSNILKCSGFQLEGLITSPDPKICRPLPPLQWWKKTFVAFEDNKLQLNQFLSASLQLLADQGLKKWRQKVTQVSVIEIQGTNGTHSLLAKVLHQVLSSLPHISATIQEIEVSQAKEKLKLDSNKSYLVVGSYESLERLWGTVGKVLTDTESCMFLLAHVYSRQTTINGSSPFKPVLTYRVKPGEKLLLLNKKADVKALRVLELTNAHWLKDLAHLFNGSDNGQPVAVVSRHHRPEELLPQLATQKYAHRLRCVFLDKSAAKFSLGSQQYHALLSMGLSVSCVLDKKPGSHFIFDLNFPTTSHQDNVQGVITSSDPSLDVDIVSLNTTTYTYQPNNPPKKVELEVVDYCGTNNSEQRVMGIAQFDQLTNSLTADDKLSWIVPRQWTMEEAVTVPVTYSLAYYIICIKSSLAAGHSVLIHIGNSPLGQACIAISLQLGADVFVTVQSQDQILPLIQDFPTLKQNQVILVDQHTKHMKLKRRGKGVDLVINCLPDVEVNNAGQCVKEFGAMILLSDVDIRRRQNIGLNMFFNSTFVLGVSLRSILNADSETKLNLQNYVRHGIKKGIVRPLKSRLFKLLSFSDALENLRTRLCDEKTVVDVKSDGRNGIPSSISSFLCEQDKTYVIVGSGGSLWLDLAEWLIQRGARKLLLAPASAQLTANCCCRVDRLVSLSYLRVMLTSATRISSVDDTCTLLRDAELLGPVSAVFCVALDDNPPTVSYLDKASRLVLTSLPHFICLLSGGGRECELRSQEGLHACVVLPETSCSSLPHFEAVLPYLSYVLAESSHSTDHYYTFSDQIFSADKFDVKISEQKFSEYLPSSVTDLISLGEEVDQVSILQEVVTLSPRYKFVKHNLLPVFLFPGTSCQNMEPLYRRLMHPAYITKPLLRPSTVQQTALVLLEEVLKVQPHGPYNLLGESLGGAVALQLASLLEAQGHQVEVFLLEAAPTSLQECIKSWTENFCSSLPVSLISLLPLQAKVVEQLAEIEDWEHQLSEALRHIQPQLKMSENICVKKAMTFLKNSLTALTAFQPPNQLLKASVNLIRHKGATEFDHSGLEQYCQQKPTLHTTEEENHQGMMKSPATVKIINENLLYTWSI